MKRSTHKSLIAVILSLVYELGTLILSRAGQIAMVRNFALLKVISLALLLFRKLYRYHLNRKLYVQYT